MDTFVVLLAMRVRKPSDNLLRVKGEKRRFIHEAEDFAVFSPHPYKLASSYVVPKGGLEPPCPFGHNALNVACLPISPLWLDPFVMGI